MLKNQKRSRAQDEGADAAMEDGPSTDGRTVKGFREPIQQESTEMGDFEDQWEDEEVGDDDEGEVHIEPNSDDEDEAMEVEQDVDEEPTAKTYIPGQELEEGEELVVDNSTYEMLHSMDVEWPCLSFDILRDNLGADRKHFPHTTNMVAGTQAERRKDNKIYVMKVSQLHRTKTDDDDEEDDNDEDLDEDPILEHKAIAHDGGVNRIRAMHLTEKHIVATWAETNKVHIWDITPHVNSLDSTTPPPPGARPLFSIDRHRDEGFAMDWSPVHAGKLLTGANDKQIFFTQANSAGTFTTDALPFTGHKGSVEDIQWSPYGEDTFVSASSDQTIRVWDLRQSRKKGPMLTVKAHDSDVNVLSWNRTNQQLLASGSDSGVFSIWDLRVLASAKDPSQIAPAASFEWHTKPITSIEWAPHDVSVLAVSGADDQLTLWDLSLERDAEEQGTMLTGPDDVEVKVPAQLLFIHQGQKQIKETHWHRQIPGMLVSTAETGFNLFKTINS